MRTGYGSKLVGQTLSVSTYRNTHLNLLRLEEELSVVHFRLNRVCIENKPYEKIFERYDKPHTFFYIDPPYHGCEDYYGDGIFGREDFRKLQGILEQIKGRFILSINDVPEIRKLFKGFKIETVGTTYNVAANQKKKVQELLIMNY